MPNEPQYWPSGGQTPVRSITPAASAFIIEHSRLLDFDVFLSKSLLEQAAAIVRSGTVPPGGSPLAHKSLLLELVLTRTVDNFLCFLSDLIALIYKAKPEMLRSSESEKLDFILQFTDMDQLRSAVAEKRVERLSYLGLRELSDYIESQMSFQLFGSPDRLQEAARIVELRNICVHARGVVSSRSTKRFPELKDQLGKRIDLSSSKVTSDRKFIEDCVFDIDARATSKFSLPARQLPAPPPDL